MLKITDSYNCFLELLRAGLWEKEAHLAAYDKVDFEEICRLAEEQSVVGLVTAGLEHTSDVQIPKVIVLQFIGRALQIEQQNKAMNHFIGGIIESMRNAGIYTLLIKGQGIAQCYEKPLWRSSGDVDFFLSEDNYNKAKAYLSPLSSSSRAEGDIGVHHELIIDQWVVELHGDLRNGLSRRMDKVLTEIQNDIIYKGNVRSWMNGNTQVFLPGACEDAVFVFTHIIKHLFKGGIGLRQICDWCRLLWKYRDALDIHLLEAQIKRAGLMSEWKVFASLAVNKLGMPEEAMPFYSPANKWKKMSNRLLLLIFEAGNFGHNKDISYQSKYKGIVRKTISLANQVKDSLRLSAIFPLDAFRFLFGFTVIKTRKSLKGE